MKSISFFLRFYSQSREQVEAHMADYSRLFPKVTGTKVKPLTQSVNAAIPANSWEATAVFATVADRDEACNDLSGIKWYRKRAYPAPGATFVMRGKKDMAFKNPVKL